MSKLLYGMLLGAALSVLDGMSAWLTPEVQSQIIGIIIGSTIKGVVAGVSIGWFAKKVNSLPLGILFGLAVGMFLAFLVAAMPNPEGKHYYFEIMLPGSLVGAIVGYATQKHNPPQMAAEHVNG